MYSHRVPAVRTWGLGKLPTEAWALKDRFTLADEGREAGDQVDGDEQSPGAAPLLGDLPMVTVFVCRPIPGIWNSVGTAGGSQDISAY